MIGFERLWPSIFPWHLGYTLLWSGLPLYNLADAIGFAGLSALFLFLQALIGAIYLETKKNRQFFYRWVAAISLAILLLVLNIIGLQKEKFWKQKISQADLQLEVGITQVNIGNMDDQYLKYGSRFPSMIMNSYFDETQKLITNHSKKLDLLIWPESALAFPLNPAFLNNFNQQQLRERLQGWQVSLFTGAYGQSTELKSPLGGPLSYNSSFLLNSQGEVLGEYSKTILLAFGEYLPLGESFPALFKLFPYTGHFGRGPGPSVLSFPVHGKTLQIGPQICYESLFSDFSRGLAQQGADVIINVTNDSWYGPFSEQFQHLYMTLARAIEVRRPLIRSTNTGISSIILADGKILDQSPYSAVWSKGFTVPINLSQEPTFFVQYGSFDFFLWLLLTILCIFSLHKLKKEKGLES